MLNHNFLFRDGVCYEDTLCFFYVLKYIISISLVRDHTLFYHIRSNSINITGNGEIVNAPSWLVICNDVLTNLSEGWERKKMAFLQMGSVDVMLHLFGMFFLCIGRKYGTTAV